MHIILTHEQADFDSLASMLGAWLLAEDALPILPRRMNRNCQAFLALYSSELPFVNPRDLPSEDVELVTLVDTQSLITIKGTGERTEVYVIDHHPERQDLPKNWKCNFEKLGACTTIFVERLHEIKKPLTPLQATLLLIGIYEDTGSLTYVSTTPRDIRAAAYLLEEGALLRIANDHLNPPLTNGQRDVYDRLLDTMQSHQVHGQKIIIAAASAKDLTEEISSIAHKMRDLLDPDALFVLVNTTEGIRIVARAATDRVDVAAVASYFGGGGHSRAAAALLRRENDSNDEATLQQVAQELLEILPDFIQPPITVGQIMSRRPLLIPPEMSAREAAHLMQRYGYEGYPVVKNGRVIGLLTRRAVDRALSHKLNLTAGSLMEANEISVFPGDSLDHLQKLMIDSGWGQVPVISPEDGEIIGIVTRTDLLKIQAGNNTLVSGRENLSQKLEEILPHGKLALLKLISEKAYGQRVAAYIVGGFVRDLLLNKPGVDFDVVIEGDAIALARSLANEFGGRVVSHKRFGTAKWQIQEIKPEIASALFDSESVNPQDFPESLDLISARTEFYEYPTALPTVERGSIKLDLHRRDFTINTLALRLDGRHYGELYDYWGGLHDLEQGEVRVLHSLSFVDDPTRMLRAVRFEQRFGFKIEQRTLHLMAEARTMLRQLTGSRIQHEFDLILAEDNPVDMLNRLKELDLLAAIHPALTWEAKQGEALNRVLHAPLDKPWHLPDKFGHYPIRRALAYLVWFIRLPLTDNQDLAERLRLPSAVQGALRTGSTLIQELPSLSSGPVSQIVERLETTPRPALYAIYQTETNPEIRDIIQHYLDRWQHIQIQTDGKVLKSMGIEPGPIYSRILTTLKAARLDGQIQSNEEENALLRQMVRAIARFE